MVFEQLSQQLALRGDTLPEQLDSALYIVAPFLPVLILYYVLFTQSKKIAAFAQISSLQTRNEQYMNREAAKPSKEKTDKEDEGNRAKTAPAEASDRNTISRSQSVQLGPDMRRNNSRRNTQGPANFLHRFRDAEIQQVVEGYAKEKQKALSVRGRAGSVDATAFKEMEVHREKRGESVATDSVSSVSSDLSEEEIQKITGNLIKHAMKADRQWFVIGVMNCMLTPFLLGMAPTYYYLYFTPKVSSLILLRWKKFVLRKQHYLLYDFCYWANFICLAYVWWLYDSAACFRVIFTCSTGPLAFATLAFNHSLIFHSYAHVTSVVVHISPLLLCWGLRWFRTEELQFNVCGADGKNFPACNDEESTIVNLVKDSMQYFYLWWSVLYYCWIFVALGSYLEQNHFQTLWDRILTMGKIGKTFTGMMDRGVPKLVVQALYLGVHLIYSTITMTFAALLWHNFAAHTAFVIAVVFSTVWNGAGFYMKMMEPLYSEALTNYHSPSDNKDINSDIAKRLKMYQSSSYSMEYLKNEVPKPGKKKN